MSFPAHLTLEEANTIVAGVFADAKRRGLKPLAVVVLDAGGHVVTYQRQDGSSLMRFQVAMAKASGALGMGQSSRKLGQLASDRPSFVGALASLAPYGLAPSAGGVLIKGRDGMVAGAVGVTGDTADNDEACGVAGIEAAGLTAFD